MWTPQNCSNFSPTYYSFRRYSYLVYREVHLRGKREKGPVLDYKGPKHKRGDVLCTYNAIAQDQEPDCVHVYYNHRFLESACLFPAQNTKSNAVNITDCGYEQIVRRWPLTMMEGLFLLHNTTPELHTAMATRRKGTNQANDCTINRNWASLRRRQSPSPPWRKHLVPRVTRVTEYWWWPGY